ncbi:hypothetical protein PENSTE_c013G09965 [Penicillium steckii]|uniref:Mid2 domain-containing protein n=1 Tax=Penicillium steckii TaxID=303698 RepID=A0A1V6T2S7_9EURO|nr:hypothetical protein PENSTE_c013G09965 [Penicillium steckii]
MSDDSNFGWSIRRNGSTCLGSEVDCGPTVPPFRNCCPSGSFCPHANNVACCPTEEFCDDALNGQPHCANSTWDLYINGGYFCCDKGTIGYAVDGGSNGCGEPGYKLQEGETSLKVVSAAPTTTSSSSISTSTSSPSTTPAPTATQSASAESSSTTANTGAIAGGVVGGVAGAAILIALAWYFIRRSRKPQPLQSEPSEQMATSNHYQPVPPAELSVEGSSVSELPGVGKPTPVAELPTTYR